MQWRAISDLSNGNDVNLATTKRLLDSLTYIMIIYSGSWALTVFAMLLIQVIIPDTDLAKVSLFLEINYSILTFLVMIALFLQRYLYFRLISCCVCENN